MKTEHPTLNLDCYNSPGNQILPKRGTSVLIVVPLRDFKKNCCHGLIFPKQRNGTIDLKAPVHCCV